MQKPVPVGGVRARSLCGVPDEVERERLAASFGAVLKELRARAGMTQATLAARSGVSARMVAYLEVGRRRPSASMVLVLAAGLNRPDLPPAAPPLRSAESAALLTAAAGGSLVADTPGGARRRERRCRRARWVYHREVLAWERGRAARRKAEIVAGMAPLLNVRELRRLVRALR